MAEENSVLVGQANNGDEQQPDHLKVFKDEITARLTMSFDNYSFHLNCDCIPPKKTVFSTCWEDLDKGRRVLKCPCNDGKGCGYMRFVDGPMSGRPMEVIGFMYEVIEQLIFENTVARTYMRHLDDDYENALKELNVSRPSSSNL